MLRRRFAVVLCLVLAAVPLGAQQGPLRGLDAYIASVLRDWEAPGLALAVVKDDRVVYARGYGVRELGKPDTVDANTIFAVGSTTKAFTSALLAMLVDAGRLGWDDPVTRHLPGFQLFDPYVTRELTIRDLLTHRSGLVRGDRLWAGSGFSRAEILRRVRFLEPSWGFRAQYGYQNIMFLAAGELAARVSGQSWDDATRERIFLPLGMTRSVTSVRPLSSMENVATPHERIEGALSPVPWFNIDNVGPAGSINSSVRDMAEWIRLQLGLGTYEGRKLIDSASVKEMHTIQMHIKPGALEERLYPESHLHGYGLAWSLRDYRGRKIVSHGGAIRGMRAMVGLVPEERLGVVVLTNTPESNLPTAVMYRVIDQYLGSPVKDWSALYLSEVKAGRERAAAEAARVRAERVPDTRPTLALSAYAGTYADSMYGEITVREASNGLQVTFGPEFTGTLSHWHYDTFEVLWSQRHQGRASVTFTVDARGRVSGLVVPGLATFGRVPAREEGAR